MSNNVTFALLDNSNKDIETMSILATSILRQYYDSIIGEEQNTYMLKKFQSFAAIQEQLEHGYIYYFIRINNKNIGFLAYFFRLDHLYLSKLYLKEEYRNKGYGYASIEFLKVKAKEANLNAIELNVNKYNPTRFVYEKLGFKNDRSECNDIGNGFYMDDYVYRLEGF